MPRSLGPRKNYRRCKASAKRLCASCHYLEKPDKFYLVRYETVACTCTREPALVMQWYVANRRTCDGWKKEEVDA